MGPHWGAGGLAGLWGDPLISTGTRQQMIDGETWNVTEFDTTPRMSTYLLAFIVSQFTYVESDLERTLVGWGGVHPLPTWVAELGPLMSPPSLLSRFASGAAPRPSMRARVTTHSMSLAPSSASLRRITTRPTRSQSLVGAAGRPGHWVEVPTAEGEDGCQRGTDGTPPSPDQVGLPDFNAGAMENWGLVTYRENSLLFDAAYSSIGNKERVVTVIAHELAHQVPAAPLAHSPD